MWANNSITALATWLKEFNASKARDKQVGFYGLDVYSLFDSIQVVVDELNKIDPKLAESVKQRYGCFDGMCMLTCSVARSPRLAYVSRL